MCLKTQGDFCLNFPLPPGWLLVFLTCLQNWLSATNIRFRFIEMDNIAHGSGLIPDLAYTGVSSSKSCVNSTNTFARESTSLYSLQWAEVCAEVTPGTWNTITVIQNNLAIGERVWWCFDDIHSSVMYSCSAACCDWLYHFRVAEESLLTVLPCLHEDIIVEFARSGNLLTVYDHNAVQVIGLY